MRFRPFYITIGGFALCLTILISCWAGWRQTSLASRMIRLHVVANSDSEEDQSLKLLVRDAVLKECGTALTDSSNSSQAVEALEGRMRQIAAVGSQVVQKQGYNYPVRVKLEYTGFPMTDYDGFSLPAGRYRALRVEIGEGEGHNWWCVVFPTLCTASVSEMSQTAMAEGLTEEDVALITRSSTDYVIRFRCVELWEELLEAIGNRY